MIVAESTLNQRAKEVIVTFYQKIDTSQTFFCFFSILSQKKVKALKNIMHLKTNRYAVDEICYDLLLAH